MSEFLLKIELLNEGTWMVTDDKFQKREFADFKDMVEFVKEFSRAKSARRIEAGGLLGGPSDV